MVNEKMVELGLKMLAVEFGEKKARNAIDSVKKFELEVPSWVFGTFGGEVRGGSAARRR